MITQKSKYPIPRSAITLLVVRCVCNSVNRHLITGAAEVRERLGEAATSFGADLVASTSPKEPTAWYVLTRWDWSPITSRSSSHRCDSDNGGCRVQPDDEPSVVSLFSSSYNDLSDREVKSRILLFIQRAKRRITEAWTARNLKAITSKGEMNYG